MTLRQSALRAGLAVATGLTWAFAAGCSVDSSTKSTPTVVEEESFTVLVEAQPLTSLRTEETWGLWTTPVYATFPMTFDGMEADNHADADSDDGHDDKPVAIADGDEMVVTLIGSATVEGLGIRVQTQPVGTTWQMGHDGMEMLVPQAGETHHLMVFLEDAVGGHPSHGNANIPGAKVHIEFAVEGEEQEIPLRAVQGRHGLRYEANAAVPSGTYDLTVHVTPPAVVRDDVTKDRWLQDVEAALAGFEVGEGSGSATAGGMTVSVRTGAPKTYGAMGMGALPLTGEETVNFSVRLEDPETPASGDGEMVAHGAVKATVTNDATGVAVTRTLAPMYGAAGFHYAANFALPQVVSGGEAVEDHDDSDGH